MLNGNQTGLGSTLARLCVAAATMCLSGFAAALTVGDRVENFRLMDHAGDLTSCTTCRRTRHGTDGA